MGDVGRLFWMMGSWGRCVECRVEDAVYLYPVYVRTVQPTPTNSISLSHHAIPSSNPPPSRLVQQQGTHSTVIPITRIAIAASTQAGTEIRDTPKSHSPHVPRGTKTYDAVPAAPGIASPANPILSPHINPPTNALISPRSCRPIRHHRYRRGYLGGYGDCYCLHCPPSSAGSGGRL